MPQSAGDEFFDVWNVYRKVVSGDYMRHHDLAAALNQILRSRFGDQPFSLLDLGCGDGTALPPVLAGVRLHTYRGVDLSETALGLAEKHLKRLGCPATFVRAHMLDGLTEEAQYDVIYSSFALHHLSSAEKAEFFDRAGQRLTERGLLLLVDIMRAEGEGLVEFRQRYCAWVREAWNGLESGEKDSVCAHVVANDLPETFSALLRLTSSAGLAGDPRVIRHDWHQIAVFTPSATKRASPSRLGV